MRAAILSFAFAVLIPAQTRSYLHNGDSMAQETVGASTASFLKFRGSPEAFARSEGGASYGFTKDYLRTVLGLTDASGTVTTSYAYQPFGASSSTGAAANNGKQFAGTENDGTTLFHMGARYYSPSLRRLISPNPLGAEPRRISLPT